MENIIKNANNVLLLKGKYEVKGNDSGGGPSNLPNGASFEISKFLKFINQLRKIESFWEKEKLIKGALVSIHYTRVIPKSKRVSSTLKEKGIETNSTIVGAKFINQKHVITHYFKDKNVLLEGINALQEAYDFSKSTFGDIITSEEFNVKKGIVSSIDYSPMNIGKTKYRNMVVELYNVEKFEVPTYEYNDNDNVNKSIVSLYKISDMSLEDLLEKLNLFGDNSYFVKILDSTDGNVIQINKSGLDKILERAPYLVANAVRDLLNISPSEISDQKENIRLLPKPSNDIPTIGVLDTGYVSKQYFNDWVEYDGSYLGEQYDARKNNDTHGTEIDSILVDGFMINGDRFDDGCGNFKVKHFGVVSKNGEPSTIVMKRIEKIIDNNQSIHVWNLSIGSDRQIENNYISFEASILDKLQYKYKNIIFVVAGTNKPESNSSEHYKIGAPADSINSIVVNAADADKNPASYSREGPVLSFFNKPDIATFGGDKNLGVRVCNHLGEHITCGTSYAAPWISRKLCFLIDKMNLHREEAKALLIDSAAGWERDEAKKKYIGYGIVPTHINDILKTDSDEIRFILSDNSSSYKTYNYSLPIPLVDDKYPFIARATLCYFPSCTRNQGVDYTDTELSIKFGRVGDGQNKIIDINENIQDDTESNTTEAVARKEQRKWDNVKFISSLLKSSNKPLKSYENKMWGIAITSKQRISKVIPNIRFGIVVTLKEINGKNRIDSFIENCKLKEWNVTKIDIEAFNKIYAKAQEDIKFNK